jgi:hypothetical protein
MSTTARHCVCLVSRTQRPKAPCAWSEFDAEAGRCGVEVRGLSCEGLRIPIECSTREMPASEHRKLHREAVDSCGGGRTEFRSQRYSSGSPGAPPWQWGRLRSQMSEPFAPYSCPQRLQRRTRRTGRGRCLPDRCGGRPSARSAIGIAYFRGPFVLRHSLCLLHPGHHETLTPPSLHEASHPIKGVLRLCATDGTKNALREPRL